MQDWKGDYGLCSMLMPHLFRSIRQGSSSDSMLQLLGTPLHEHLETHILVCVMHQYVHQGHVYLQQIYVLGQHADCAEAFDVEVWDACILRLLAGRYSCHYLRVFSCWVEHTVCVVILSKVDWSDDDVKSPCSTPPPPPSADREYGQSRNRSAGDDTCVKSCTADYD